MTKTDALQITIHAEDLAPIHDHAIAADLRAAKARLRRRDARGLREEPALDMARVEADFAALFATEG